MLPISELKPQMVVIEQNRFCAAAVRYYAAAAFPAAEISVYHDSAEALCRLRLNAAHLGLIGLNFPDGDGLDLIAGIVRERLLDRVLVVSERSDERARSFLRAVGIGGFFDCASESPENLIGAVRSVTAGRPWFSSSFRTRASAATAGLDELLTSSELQELSHHTIRTHRESIMRKLDVQTRAEMCREAIVRGVVRILQNGVVLRPGFKQLLADRSASVATRSAGPTASVTTTNVVF